MSITFWCPEAPTVTTTPCPDEPECTFQESSLPEVNVSNSNAGVALEMLGQVSNDEQAGSLAVDELEPALRRLRSVLAHGVERAAFLEPCMVNGQCVSTRKQDGSFAAAAAPGSLEQLLRFKLTSAVPPVPTLASQLHPPGGGVRFVNLGRSDDYVRSLAERLIGLLTQAKAQEFKVCWG